MSEAGLDTLGPSATPDVEAIAVWKSLSREEQIRRTRAVLASAEASTATETTMKALWAQIAAETQARE